MKGLQRTSAFVIRFGQKGFEREKRKAYKQGSETQDERGESVYRDAQKNHRKIEHYNGKDAEAKTEHKAF